MHGAEEHCPKISVKLVEPEPPYKMLRVKEKLAMFRTCRRRNLTHSSKEYVTGAMYMCYKSTLKAEFMLCLVIEKKKAKEKKLML